MARPKPGPCVNCGADTTKLGASLGRCKTCYMYWRRHGEDRSWRTAAPPCPLCGEPLPSDTRQCRRGYHEVCYQRLRRKGLLTLVRVKVAYPRPCKHCGCPTLYPLKGWCKACYDRWRTRGSLAYVRSTDLTCQNCGEQRRRRLRGADGGYEGKAGLCGPCTKYENRFKKTRPERIWRTYQYQPRPKALDKTLAPRL